MAGGKLLGRIIKQWESCPERTKGLTVVPFEIVEDEDGNYYKCVIVRGRLLGGQGIGTVVTCMFDFHDPLKDDFVISEDYLPLKKPLESA